MLDIDTIEEYEQWDIDAIFSLVLSGGWCRA